MRTDRMTVRELVEYVKKLPGFATLSNVDVIMGDVYGVAKATKNLGSTVEITIAVSEYWG